MHGVVSLLDQTNDRVVRSLSRELEEVFGVHPRYKTPAPHFSYQVSTKYDFELLERKLRRFAKKAHKFRLHAGGLGIFTGFTPVLYIPVVRTSELSKFHGSLVNNIGSAAKGRSPLYEPDSWVPHITLAQGGVNERTLKKVIGKLSRTEIELDITVDNIAVMFFDGTKHAVRFRTLLGQT